MLVKSQVVSEKESQAELQQRLNEAEKYVSVGSRYQHYKGPTYQVVDLALLEATNEPYVVYQAEYGNYITFIRPVSAWTELVEFNGENVQRFTKIVTAD